MTGLQALARLPIEQLRADRLAGLRTAAFITGYPGSPLGGYDGELAQAIKHVSDADVVLAPAVNEEQAVTAVMGSQLASRRDDRRYDGVLGIFYAKGPGVDRAGDALRHAVYAGAAACGGAVVIAGDDPMAKSSTIPSSSAGTLVDKHIPVLYPGSPGEALDLGRHAVYLSRATGLWTSLKIVSDVGDGSGTVHLDPARVQPIIPTIDGEEYRHTPDGRLLTPATVHTEREICEVRLPLAIEYAALNRLNHTTVNPADAWIGIVASGTTYGELRDALRRLGLDSDSDISAAGIRLLRMHMPMPFSPETVRRFARGLEEVLVVEEKHPDIESLVKDALYNESRRPRVTGKFDEHDDVLLPGHGGLSADDLIGPLRRRLGQRIGHRLAPATPRRELIPLNTEVARSPYFCSGCPHNRSTKVPDGAAVGGGIGCHTMTLLMDSDGFGDMIGLTCMGQEGTQWIGMAPFVDTPHIFQNIGDGTYFHSGQLAISGAVAAGVNMTYKLLWNRTVAMTGGQDPTGVLGVAEVCRVLLAQGAARVLVTTDDTARYRDRDLPDGVDLWPRSRLMEAQELLADTAGVTVLIHDQQCAAEARRARKRGTAAPPRQRVFINERICEGCGDCVRASNCLSVQPVETDFGRKTRIDQTSCNLDYSCLDGDCPSFMTVTEPGRVRSWLRRARARFSRSLSPSRSAAAVSSSSSSAAAASSSSSSSAPLSSASASPSGSSKRRAEGAVSDAPQDLDDPSPVVPSDDLSIRIVGIGGTGVVTVSQVIATAAMFDGFEVSGLDQIGLSQKAGPVVSDLRLVRGGPANSNRLGAGQADVLLALDQLTAASPNALSAADPARTVVVGSLSQTPPGSKVAHPERTMPKPDQLAAAVARSTRDDCRHWVDAQAVTETLFGNSVTANVLVVGMAVQAGALPLEPGSVEQAIELNGVAIHSNIAAFRWGRALIARPDKVPTVTARLEDPDAPAQLDETLTERVRAVASTAGFDTADGDEDGYVGAIDLERLAAELCAYQSSRLAGRFLDFVEAVAVADSARGDGSFRLSRAATRGYFKLLAYKDEYEVARLMLDPGATAEARERAAAVGGKAAWQLHPPVLRAMGMKSKIAVPLWCTPAIRLLAGLRRLRGTPFDLFGYSTVRRAERSLAREYRAAIVADLGDLDPAGYETALERARLAETVRGYEQIKLDAIAPVRQRLTQR